MLLLKMKSLISLRNKSIFFLFLSSTLLSGCSKRIQKQVEVTDRVGRVFKERVRPLITKKCLEKSISKKELNQLLSKGVKVIDVNEYSYDIIYENIYRKSTIKDGYVTFYGTCFNKAYILEGPKRILEKY